MLKMYDLLNCNVPSKEETDDGVYCIIGQTADMQADRIFKLSLSL